MQATTSMVDGIAARLENGVKENARNEHDRRPIQSDLINYGLHLFEAISRLRINPKSEVESVVLLHKGLDPDCIAATSLCPDQDMAIDSRGGGRDSAELPLSPIRRCSDRERVSPRGPNSD